MPPSEETRIRQKVDLIDMRLRSSGEYRLTNDEDAYAIYEGILRIHRGSNLSVDHPKLRFGGEYVFRLSPMNDDDQTVG
ncbi:hypothetical protein [Shinella sp. DD12]|uniref:hypothetical protein n=1 Tax=Shinella sp. DD12 TaxID=1410620 RepID=UPI000437BC73|nr:hypothetical protein [Shinella sp. DD12]EYR82664.1 hypothetical protein SHLA_53c000140 [Shinella sp. DD12]